MAHLPRPTTILMADDDPDDRLMARDAFVECGVPGELRFVEDGEELMDYLRRRGKYGDPSAAPRPGLLLLDLNMPRKDGWECLREIRADPGLRPLRIVILTTSHTPEDVLRSYEMCASSYITKPTSYATLVEMVRTLGKYWLEMVELPAEPGIGS
jgi:CheY-like chemotaxis protein